MGFKEEMAACSLLAGGCMEKLKTGDFTGEEEFYRLVKRYALAKFLLPEEEMPDEIDMLAAMSISNLTHIPPEVLKQNDKPSGCTMATAVSDKKVLLILSLCKALGVKLKPGITPKLQTVRELSGQLFLEYQGKQA